MKEDKRKYKVDHGLDKDAMKADPLIRDRGPGPRKEQRRPRPDKSIRSRWTKREGAEELMLTTGDMSPVEYGNNFRNVYYDPTRDKPGYSEWYLRRHPEKRGRKPAPWRAALYYEGAISSLGYWETEEEARQAVIDFLSLPPEERLPSLTPGLRGVQVVDLKKIYPPTYEDWNDPQFVPPPKIYIVRAKFRWIQNIARHETASEIRPIGIYLSADEAIAARDEWENQVLQSLSVAQAIFIPFAYPLIISEKLGDLAMRYGLSHPNVMMPWDPPRAQYGSVAEIIEHAESLAPREESVVYKEPPKVKKSKLELKEEEQYGRVLSDEERLALEEYESMLKIKPSKEDEKLYESGE